MTSIVIPLATGSTASRWGEELRYCLRSVEKHLKGYGEVFIVGQAPAWLKNVTVIPATDHDKTYYKERNIFLKVMLACNDERVSEDFLFMNDDHFLLSEFEAGAFPFYIGEGWLSGELKRSSPYRQTIQNAVNWLFEQQEEDEFYFDIHSPILYNKNTFQELCKLNWSIKYGYPIKTMYATILKRRIKEDHPMLEADRIKDLKISGSKTSTEIKALIKNRLFFSTNDNSREGGMLAVFQELYPNKSKYER